MSDPVLKASTQPGFMPYQVRVSPEISLVKTRSCLVGQKTRLDCSSWGLGSGPSAFRIVFILCYVLCSVIYSTDCSHLIALLLSFLPTDQIQGTVSLKNISTSTSGLYQCTSSNAIGKSTCLLNLQVVERKDAHGHKECYYCTHAIICWKSTHENSPVASRWFSSMRRYILKSCSLALKKWEGPVICYEQKNSLNKLVRSNWVQQVNQQSWFLS